MPEASQCWRSEELGCSELKEAVKGASRGDYFGKLKQLLEKMEGQRKLRFLHKCGWQRCSTFESCTKGI